MNREIKFRMFEKATNLMHYENNDVIFGLLSAWSDKYDLMQFTGRTDINDNEIWEGDICKDSYGRTVVVRWINDLYWYGDSSHPGFWFTHATHINENEFDLNYHNSFDTLEIIGNIYEHPELLKND